MLADSDRLGTERRFTGQFRPAQHVQHSYSTRGSVRSAHKPQRPHRLSGHARAQPRISAKAASIGEYVDGDRPGREQYCGVFCVAPCVRSLSLCIPKRALAGVLQRANFAESRRTCSFWHGASPARRPAYMCSVSEPLTQPQAPSRPCIPAYAPAQATPRARAWFVPHEMIVSQAARVRAVPGTSAAPAYAKDSLC